MQHATIVVTNLFCSPFPIHTNDLQQQKLMLLIIFKTLEAQ
jgi:hypothetical protein